MGEEEAEGSDEAAFQRRCQGAFWVFKLGVVSRVASLFTELGGFAVEKFGRVSFCEEEKAADLDDAVRDGGRVEGPTP